MDALPALGDRAEAAYARSVPSVAKPVTRLRTHLAWMAAGWRRLPRWARGTATGTAWGAGVLLAMWLAAREFSARDLAATFSSVDMHWIAIAAACYAAGIVAGSLSWAIGLSAGGFGGVPFKHVAASHWIGYGVGALLPGHLGEAARLMALRRHVSAGPGRVPRIAGSMLAQHVLDGLAILMVVVAVSLAIPMPGPLGELRWVALGVLVSLPLVALLGRRADLTRRLARRLAPRPRRALDGLAAGAGVLFRREALPAFACQAVAIGGRFGALLGVVYAFGLAVPLSAALVVFTLLAAAAVLPAAPGGLGARQAAIVVPLATIYGVASEQALALSLGFQATLAAVAVAGGTLALVHQSIVRPRLAPA